MNAHEENRIEQLLKQALPPVPPQAEPPRDLWPEVLRRLDADPAAVSGLVRTSWFDWALVAGLVVFALSFPATIPVFLYFL